MFFILKLYFIYQKLNLWLKNDKITTKVSLRYYAQWKKPGTKDYTLCDSIYVKFPEKRIYKAKKQQIDVVYGWEWKQRLSTRGMMDLGEGRKNVLKLVYVDI